MIREILDKNRQPPVKPKYTKDETIEGQNKLIDQALAQIKDKILEKLPKEKPRSQYVQLGDRDNIGLFERDLQNAGFNDCLSQIKKIIEEG
jgi:DNA-binding transcriptional MerR regulator